MIDSVGSMWVTLGLVAAAAAEAKPGVNRSQLPDMVSGQTRSCLPRWDLRVLLFVQPFIIDSHCIDCVREWGVYALRATAGIHP